MVLGNGGYDRPVGLDRYDMSNFGFEIDLDIPDREIPPPPSSNIPSNVVEYRTYFYEVANLVVGAGIGIQNWAYSLYPPEADDGQFFDYSSIVRLQDGFSGQFDAIADAESYIDSIMGGTIVDIEQGDAEIIGLDIIPEAPDLSELRPDGGGGSSSSSSSSFIDLKANTNFPFAYIGLGVFAFFALNRK